MDTTAAAIGSGAVRDGDPHLYLGTSSWIGAHVARKKTDIFTAIASIPCAIPGKYLMTALQATAGGNIAFFRDKILYPDDALRESGCPEDFFERVERLIENSPAGSRGIIYTPWIFGERAPIEDHSIRAGFHNISLEHTRADLIRAIHEGVGLNTRWLLGPVEKFLGRRVESIAAVGGGARSDAWCQIFADVLERPIRQIENPIEANVRGSAFIAAVALGKLKFDDVAELVAAKRIYQPRSEHKSLYDAHFRSMIRLYHAGKRKRP
jgi:xylulokinase